MEHLIQAWPVALTAINLIWSLLNMRTQWTFEKRMRDIFITRTECDLKRALSDVRHEEIKERLERAGA